VFSVRYELNFYIPEDGTLYSHRRENLKYDKLTFHLSEYWEVCRMLDYHNGSEARCHLPAHSAV
jgi:hypothetical protein